MLTVYANSFMTAAGHTHPKLQTMQPSFAWYHIWHTFIQRLKDH